MAYNRIQARRVCTSAELDLFEASLADRIGSHTPAELRNKVQRARNLRDKYRDLYKRQRLAARDRTGSKKGGRADGNQRTARKARMFDEALNRLQARVDKLSKN